MRARRTVYYLSIDGALLEMLMSFKITFGIVNKARIKCVVSAEENIERKNDKAISSI